MKRVSGAEYIELPGEGSHPDPLSHEDLVSLVLNQGAVNAIDPDEADDVINVAPRLKATDMISVFADLNEYMLWQECVDANDIQMVKELQSKMLRASEAAKVQIGLGFSVVPKPF